MPTVVGIEWPAMAGLDEALERSQWLSADERAAKQRAQLRQVWLHARDTCAHYETLGDTWADVPVMTRDDVIAAGAGLLTRAYPSTHGPVEDVSTSRTSGEPVRVKATSVLRALYAAVTLRDHRWHRRDLHAKQCAIRYTGDAAPPPDGLHTAGWGAATARLAPDAPMAVLSVKSSTEQQLAWLQREAPAYLLIYPTVLDTLVRRMAETGITLPGLREVRTISEALMPETRALVAEVLRVPLTDTYSAQEVGYIALSCPSGAGYHVQSERLLVEILRDDGTACVAGETGRVIVTDLHNFATPLLRYDLGDHAEVGAPCACGRGLPVLTRVLGRRRGMLRYPDGRTIFPIFTMALRAAARFREIQLVQDDLHTIRVRVEADAPLTSADRASLLEAVQRCFDHPFDVTIDQVDDIGRTAAGKREEFVSLVPDPDD